MAGAGAHRHAAGAERRPRTAPPFAFFAVVSIAVIGLYIAYVIPIFLRWRMGDAFEPRAVDARAASTSGSNPIAVIWVVIICVVIFCLPFDARSAVPWNDEFDWRATSTTRRSWSAW